MNTATIKNPIFAEEDFGGEFFSNYRVREGEAIIKKGILSWFGFDFSNNILNSHSDSDLTITITYPDLDNSSFNKTLQGLCQPTGSPWAISFSSSQVIALGNEIEYKNPEAILKFEVEHPEVRSYINIAKEVTKKYFPEAKIVIEFTSDPDSDTNIEEIFFRIQTNKPISEALGLLEKVDREVFDTTQRNDELFLNISIDPL